MKPSGLALGSPWLHISARAGGSPIPGARLSAGSIPTRQRARRYRTAPRAVGGPQGHTREYLRKSRHGVRLNEHLDYDCGLTVFQHACALGCEGTAKQATSVIPIVFSVAGDPIGSLLVASLARPGGNVTGLSNLGSDLAAKRLELLREVSPSLRRLAVMAAMRKGDASVVVGEMGDLLPPRQVIVRDRTAIAP